jgi:hypothetical protein
MKYISTGFCTLGARVAVWRALRMALAPVLLALLPGCWVSTGPLIGPENASTVPFQGPFKPEKEDVIVKAVANEDGSYTLTDNKGEGFTGYFLELRENWYVVQLDMKKFAEENGSGEGDEEQSPPPSAKNEPTYLYQLMRIDGRDLWFFMPECDDTTLAIKGVKADDDEQSFIRSCVFKKASALKKAGPEFIARIESGEITEEPNILHAVDGAPE